MKKSVNKKTYTGNEMKRYLGALTENFNDGLKGIKEGFQVINNKLDKHEKILNSHTEMIGTLMVDVSVIKDDMEIVKKDSKKNVDYDEFISLSRRVNKLESRS